jgi:cytoskeletal protein CcmA (bactofilin family)
MSVFCAHCRKRLILEDYNVKSYQAVAGYATCGNVTVHKQGRVAAPIQAANLMVKGTVQGDVRIRGLVEIAATGSITGKISAPSLHVSDGARIEAYCVIQPEPEATDVKSAGIITEADADGTKPLSRTRAATTSKQPQPAAVEAAEAAPAEAISKKPKTEVAPKAPRRASSNGKVAKKKTATTKSTSTRKNTGTAGSNGTSKSTSSTAAKDPKPISTPSKTKAVPPKPESAPREIKAISTRRRAATPEKK